MLPSLELLIAELNCFQNWRALHSFWTEWTLNWLSWILTLLQGSRLRPFFEIVRVKIWHGRTCASAWSALLQSVCAEEPRHIVAGERFHWSREERRFQRERFSRAWFMPVSHRTRKQSRGSAEAARMQSGSSAHPLCFHSHCATSARAQRRIWFTY